MAGRLVRAGVEAEVNQESTLLGGRDKVVTAVLPGEVVLEERGVVLVVHRNTVGSDRQGVNGLLGSAVRNLVSDTVGRTSTVKETTVQAGNRGRVRVVHHRGAAEKVLLLLGLPHEGLPVGITASDIRQVERRAQTDEEVLNGELESREEHLGLVNAKVNGLVTVNADQRETNALNVDVVHVGVKVDVVNVQIERGERGRGHSAEVGRSAKRHVGQSLTTANVVEESVLLNVRGKAGSISGLARVGGPAATNGVVGRGGVDSSRSVGISEHRNLAAELHAGAHVQNLGDVLDVDGNETLAVGNRHRGNRETGVARVPEEKGNPHLKGGLCQLRRLRAAEDLNAATGNLLVRVRGGSEAVMARPTVHGVLLTHATIPAGTLVGADHELIEVDIRVTGIVIKGVTVDREEDVLHKATTGEIGVVKSTTLGSGGSAGECEDVSERKVDNVVADNRGTVKVNRTSAVNVTSSINHNVTAVGGAREGRGRRGRNRRSRKRDVNNHVVEEIALLGDRERNRTTELGSTGLHADAGILISHGGEGAEVSVDEQDVRLLNIQKGGELLTIRVTLGHAQGSNLLNAAIKHVSSHDHLISLTIVNHQTKNTSGGHCIASRIVYSRYIKPKKR